MAKAKERAANVTSPSVDQGPSPISTTPPAKHSTEKFLAILGLLAVPLVYVLQANGVVNINWIVSTLIYAVIVAIFSWALLKWDLPLLRSWYRVGLLLLLIATLVGISVVGVTHEYRRDHAKAPDKGITTSALLSQELARELKVADAACNGASVCITDSDAGTIEHNVGGTISMDHVSRMPQLEKISFLLVAPE